MSHITPTHVRHVAKLARLRLRDDEVWKYTKELGSILGYIDMLKEVDINGVEPTAQVTTLSHTLRDDVVCPSTASPAALLSCSPLPLAQHRIQTPAAHG